jgi:hypothetical protein
VEIEKQSWTIGLSWFGDFSRICQFIKEDGFLKINEFINQLFANHE